jgi:alanine dehydrogenase
VCSGGGVVGENALKVLYALGANCTVMDINIGVLRRLSTQYPGISTMMSSKENIAAILPNMDLVLN